MRIAVVVGTRPEAIKLAPVVTLRNATRGRQLGHLVTALDDVLAQHQPAAVLVQGDTTSALAGALAANTFPRTP